MKKLFLGISALVFTAISFNTNAQTVKIHPIPQSVAWGDEIAFENSAGYTLTGEADADTDAINLFKEKFSTTDGSVELIIGERGDAAVAAYESLIPAKTEGYYLAVEKDKVVIAGNDGSGTFYGVQTFRRIASQPNVMCVTISDYPSVPQRGLVEGYYGNPYSEADRMGLFKMFGETKMNVYIYGPKDDKYHKDKWREEYPAAEAAKITDYINAAKANKVEFVWAIHPGNDIQWNDTDRQNIVRKLKAMYKLGVRTFAVFFDDVWGGEGTRGDKQAELMNYITDELNKSYNDINPCIICPTQYNRGWSSGDYLTTLGTTMNKEVRIMWTGNSVVDMINKSDMQWINQQIGRKAFIWLNYPVNDYCINHLLLGPTYGNDLDIADMLSGFTANPMEYAEASKLSLFSIADYNWNMPAYDADESWEAAMAYLMPRSTNEFRFFCENNVDLGPTVHGLRRTDESPEFVTAKQVYYNNIKSDRAAAYIAVGEQFNKFVSTARTLATTDEAPALTKEIEPWIKCFEYEGLRGVSLVEMNNALLAENPDSFINSYLRYQKYPEAQSALRARDFSGSLKVASPVVATVHVDPFIKENIGELVALYKDNYDYRTDVFPAQVLENGTYYIMHNKRYLTNLGGNVPQFRAAVDTVRPQRQEWKITTDPSTNRYKIINLEDERYINEKGEFTVSNETNPYEPVWHTYEITLLANGKYAIQNSGSAGTNFWNVNGTRIEKNSSSEALPDKYIFDIVPLGGAAKEELINTDETYYITDGKRYLTNNNVKGSGGTPTFKEVDEPSVAQEWKITIDTNGKNCYKITSNADGRYMNELGVFGTNQYYADWNTYLLTMMGDKWSIQCTQSATKNGINYIVVSGDRLESKGVARNESYTVNFVKKGDGTSIDEIGYDGFEFEFTGEGIICNEEVKTITLLTPDGRLVKNCNGNILSVEGMANGVYVVVAKGNNETKTYKVSLR